MEELLFYIVDRNYIKYLSEFESHVSYNKDEIGHSRPYLGIVLKIENYEYFVPLYSYKEHYERYKNNPSFFFIYDRKNNPLAIIKFSAMIPVPNNTKVTSLLEFNRSDKRYRDLISAEYRYINSNKKEIYKRANKMYIAVTKHKNNFLKTIACNFKLLEEKCIEYKISNMKVSSIMDIVIEKLRKEDLREAINIYDDNHNLKTNYEKLFKVYDKIYNNPAYHNIVAKIDGRIVGLATTIINYDIVEELNPFLTVWNFGIKQEYRRQRIGTKMFEYIYKFAKENNCEFISLIAERENITAQSFYESLGYIKEVGYIKLISKDS